MNFLMAMGATQEYVFLNHLLVCFLLMTDLEAELMCPPVALWVGYRVPKNLEGCS